MKEALQQLNRREFLQATGVAGSGLMLGASLASAAQARAVPADLLGGAVAKTEDFLRLNLFVELGLDGTVRIVCHRSEMGQGIRTGLPQVLADEMGADWNQVQVVQGHADKRYGSQNTDGSRSIRDFYLPMRQMGAAAGEMLKQAAAQQFGFALADLSVNKHQVIDSKSGKHIPFAELVQTAAQQNMPKLAGLTLKDSKDFTYIGKGLKNVDMPALLQGQAMFGVDVELPGMVHASIERCPVIGGRLKSLDASAAKQVAGVIDVIEIAGKPLPAMFHPLAGVAVIASNTWAAQQARQKLVIEWDLEAAKLGNSRHNSTAYAEQMQQSNRAPGEVVYRSGSVEQGFKKAKQVVEAEYNVPYLAHAAMEPLAATAQFTDQGCEIWACSQTPQSAQARVAAEVGLKAEQVTVHVTFLGGAFGRKSKPDFVIEAAILAKALKRPVKVTWSREDDMQFDYLHGISALRLRAGLDAKANITAWQGSAAFPSIMSTFGPADSPAMWELGQGFIGMPYQIDNVELHKQKAPAHMRIGWLRSVINIENSFAINSFTDELARAAGVNSKDFMLQAIGGDRNVEPQGVEYSNYGKDIKQYPYQTARAKAVIEAATESANWNGAKQEGIGLGLAYHYSFLSHIAVVAKVQWDGSKPKLLELHCACDAGLVVNPDRVKAQLEGAMVFGTNIALYSEITVRDGEVEQSNFDGYRLTRLLECPRIFITLMPASDAPRGVGEPGVPPVAPAIINAIADAGGPRIRDLPAAKTLSV